MKIYRGRAERESRVFMNELTGKNSVGIQKICRFIPFVIITVIIPLAKYRIRVYHNEEIREVLLHTQWYDEIGRAHV